MLVAHFRFAMLSGIAFLLIYNVSFAASESATTGRLALVALALLCLLRGQIPIGFARSRIWLLLFPIPYVFIQYLFVGDFGQLSRFIHLLLYSFAGSVMFVLCASDTRRTILALLVAIAAQSLIIFYSFGNFEYRAWLDTNVVQHANFGFDNMYRAPGLSSHAGASLSVVQAFGVFLGWRVLSGDSRGRDPRFSHSDRLFAGIVAVASLVSTVLVGRTGLILALAFLFLWFVFERVRFSSVVTLLGLGFLTYFLLDPFVALVFPKSEFSMFYFTRWLTGTLDFSEYGTLRVIMDFEVPALSISTFFGTGLVSIVNFANPSGHDSGFVQTYYSAGFLVSVMFYGTYFLVLLTVFRNYEKFFQISLALLIFLLELKEPFLFKYSMFFILACVYFCDRYERSRSSVRSANFTGAPGSRFSGTHQSI